MVVFTKQFSAQPIKNSSRVPLSLRSRKKISSRVPAYQNPQIIVGYCDYLFKPQPWRGQRGLGYRLKPILMKKGLGVKEDGRGIPAL